MNHSLVTESVNTTRRSEMIDVTDRVQKFVSAKNVVSGMAIVYVPHTTAAATINENADPDASLALQLEERAKFAKTPRAPRNSNQEFVSWRLWRLGGLGASDSPPGPHLPPPKIPQ